MLLFSFCSELLTPLSYHRSIEKMIRVIKKIFNVLLQHVEISNIHLKRRRNSDVLNFDTILLSRTQKKRKNRKSKTWNVIPFPCCGNAFWGWKPTLLFLHRQKINFFAFFFSYADTALELVWYLLMPNNKLSIYLQSIHLSCRSPKMQLKTENVPSTFIIICVPSNRSHLII